MRLLDQFFSKKDPFKNVPAFKQIMVNVKMEEKAFLEKMEKILPVITPGNPADTEIISTEDQKQHLQESSLPVSYPVNFDKDLSINLGIEEGTNYEMLLNRQIVIAKDKITPDQLVGKAFANLFKQIEDKISISMITDEIGMLSGCNNLESSLVLVNEIWKLIRDKIRADEIIFGIPASDEFIFTAAGKDDTIKQLDKKVKEIFNDEGHPKKISRKLYIFQKDGTTKIFRE